MTISNDVRDNEAKKFRASSLGPAVSVVLEEFLNNDISKDVRDNEAKKFRNTSNGPAVAVVFDESINLEQNLNIVLKDVPCEPDVYVGAAVRMLQTGIARNAIADSYENANLIGLVEFKSASELCNIRIIGLTLAVYLNLDVTKEYYLSDTIAGMITTIVPISSGHVKIKVGQPFDTNRLLFMKGERIIRG